MLPVEVDGILRALGLKTFQLEQILEVFTNEGGNTTQHPARREKRNGKEKV